MIQNLAIVVGTIVLALSAMVLGGILGQLGFDKEVRIPWHKIALIAFPIGVAIGFIAVAVLEW